jgi:hypothetical protein
MPQNRIGYPVFCVERPTMARIGRKRKSGTIGSKHKTAHRDIMTPKETRKERYVFGAAGKRGWKEAKGCERLSDKTDERLDQPELHPDVTKKISNKKNIILAAIFQSGKSADEQVSSFLSALQDPKFEQLIASSSLVFDNKTKNNNLRLSEVITHPPKEALFQEEPHHQVIRSLRNHLKR